MPTIAAGTSATFSIPAGQVANVSGQGIAVMLFPTSSPITLVGGSVVGPFPVTRVVNITAAIGAQIDYTVALPATSGGPSAALGIVTKPTITTPAVAGTSIGGAFTAVGTPTPSTAIAWLLDGAVISGATAIPYASQVSDSGKSLQLRVTATNTSGTLVSTSDPVAVGAASGGNPTTLATFETFDVNGNNTNTFNRIAVSELGRTSLIIRSPATNTSQIALGFRDADNLNNPNPDFSAPILINPGEEMFSDNDQFQYYARQNLASAVAGQFVEVERVITL